MLNKFRYGDNLSGRKHTCAVFLLSKSASLITGNKRCRYKTCQRLNCGNVQTNAMTTRLFKKLFFFLILSHTHFLTLYLIYVLDFTKLFYS